MDTGSLELWLAKDVALKPKVQDFLFKETKKNLSPGETFKPHVLRRKNATFST